MRNGLDFHRNLCQPASQDREVLLTGIQHYRAMIQQPWVLAGNFNEMASLEERNHGAIEMLRHCEKFKNWIENNGFIDMGFSGHKFTWVKGNSEATKKCARLSKAQCNVE